MEDEEYDSIIFTDCFSQKDDLFTANYRRNKVNQRSELEIQKMLKEGNSDYMKKYGALFRKFDVRVLKDKIWKSYNNVIFIYLIFLFVIQKAYLFLIKNNFLS